MYVGWISNPLAGFAKVRRARSRHSLGIRRKSLWRSRFRRTDLSRHHTAKTQTPCPRLQSGQDWRARVKREMCGPRPRGRASRLECTLGDETARTGEARRLRHLVSDPVAAARRRIESPDAFFPRVLMA